MKLEKHLESIQEVLDEIAAALKDPRGILAHQRRLAFLLSLGFCEVLEVYFHKLNIIKAGSRLKHDWFRQKRIKEKLEEQLITSIDSVGKIEVLIALAVKIENTRDDIAYGAPLPDEKRIMDNIRQFFELKRIVEEQVGDLFEK